jgi:hypothetical protein
VSIMLFDQGVGIPNTIDLEALERVRGLSDLFSRILGGGPGDGALIWAATELHRTSTGQSGRGRGFRDMKRFTEACGDGSLRVLSNSGEYVYSCNPGRDPSESARDFRYSIEGSLLEWRFRTPETVEMPDEQT